MTSNDDDFDRLMTAWMEAEGRVREPAGMLAATLARTRTARRRPRWLLPEWWMPTHNVARWAAVSRPAPLLVLVAALVLLAAIVVILAGASHRRLPAPFGPAANGRLVVDTNGSLEIVDPAGDAALPLVDHVPRAAGATFSGDGTRLVFWGDDSPDSLYLARADGTVVTKLVGGLWISTDKSPTWSPDGRHVAISTESGPDRHDEALFVIDVDTAVATRLDPPELAGIAAILPSWSPDGAWIAFVARPAGSPSPMSYWAIHPDGSGAHELPTSDVAPVVAPHWAPDADRLRLAYTALAGGGSTAAYVLDVATGQERRISSDGAGWWPAWSPDATRLAWLTNSTPGDIGIAAADGSAGVTYIESTGIGRPPAWSPDGREIYGLDDAGTTTIVITVDGSAPVARIRHAPSQALPDWQRVSP